MGKNTTTMETAILALSKVKAQGSKEGRQKFLTRLLVGLEKLFGDDVPDSDANWADAPGDIQEWYRSAAAADDAKKPLPDFADAAAVAPAKVAAGNGKVANGKAKAPAKAKAAKAPKARAPRARKKDGVIDKILPICFANPTKGVDEIRDMLAKKNVEAKRATVWSVRVNLIRNCAFLQSIGKLKDNPFSVSAS